MLAIGAGLPSKRKSAHFAKKKGKLIDLPGIYDLNPISRDESVVARFLYEESFDSILNIVDASQIERNLNLTVELLEYGAPVVMGLNMVDVALARGIKIDIPKLTRALKIPVLPVIARSGKGTDELLAALTEKHQAPQNPLVLEYGETIEQAIKELSKLFSGIRAKKELRWLALQFLTENSVILDALREQDFYPRAEQIRRDAANKLDSQLADHIHQVRTNFIADICLSAVEHTKNAHLPFSDRIDRIVTHRFFGIPIFLGIMWLIFQITFTWVGTPLSDLLDGFINGPFKEGAASLLDSIGTSTFLIKLVTDGIISGVGGVLVFIPQILIIFFFISVLEDSGYMARIAVVMDRIMELFGLNGKAFIPMIIGFGCNVPGIMAARSIEESKERTLTILITPFMSCSARLPVYALFAGVFFAKYQALIVLSLYVIGIVMALVVTKILSVTILKKENSVFVVELPPYRIPSLRTLWRSTWEKGKGFLKKAGTFIFAGSVIIWLLNYAGPGGFDVPMGESFLAIIGGFLAPILAPLGFGTWQAGATLIPGFLAKEVIISTMAIIYSVSENSLSSIVAGFYTPLSAYAFMLFILLYIPCLATVAAIRKETASLKWTAFAVAYPLATAYVIVLIFYQVGRLFI
ncbi:ferrous iron transport protein B [Listeria floridensis FSL S10-1187]|uniref:Ferrous iron transport protein B n=1 Tax=Listeria floridensis FSL S10-1187 TaxID=1265817 RepID=A0ABN0RHT0_9LIST|nr:ferrous iron transport protein B [Listeria floridensis FSL S10-1187]